MEVIPLWKHQQDFIERFKDKPEAAMLWQPGVGKTRTTIDLLRYKYNEVERIRRTIILAPLIILENWKQEFTKFSKIPESEICVLRGQKAQKLKLIEESGANIWILNYEGLLIEEVYQKLLKWRPEILVCDECHRVKNMSAKRTKRAILLSDLTHVRYLLTGTPILSSSLDLFSQWRILDGGRSFGKNFYAFRAKYFYDRNAHMLRSQNYWPNWTIKPATYEQLNKIIYEKASHVKKSECLSLPDLVKQTIYAEMGPEQARIYLQMKKDFIAFVKSMDKVEAVTAQLAITKALRLLQIASGFVKTDDKNEVLLENPKAQVLSELLEEITPSNKVLVWSVFHQNYKQIRKVCEDLKLKYVEVHGEVPDKQKFEAVEKFRTEEDIRVFIGNPLSGGIGLNLVEASYSIFYSRNFSLEADIQAEARNYRSGSEVHPKITRIDLITKNTIEELVAKSLASKQQIGESLLDPGRI